MDHRCVARCGCTIDAHGFINPVTGRIVKHLKKRQDVGGGKDTRWDVGGSMGNYPQSYPIVGGLVDLWNLWLSFFFPYHIWRKYPQFTTIRIIWVVILGNCQVMVEGWDSRNPEWESIGWLLVRYNSLMWGFLKMGECQNPWVVYIYIYVRK